MRRSVATPCPVRVPGNIAVEDTFSDETTTNIEYTTAFQASFRNVKPRRAPAARRGGVNFAIREDREVEGGTIAEQRTVPTTIQSRPSRRALHDARPLRAGFTVAQKECVKKEMTQAQNLTGTHDDFVVRRKSTARSSIAPGSVSHVDSKQRNSANPAPERPARRGTLYIPSEDTTQPTMWMGIFSPTKFEVAQSKDENSIGGSDLTGIAAQMAEKRKRRSIVQSQAKRVPLQHNTTAGEQNVPPADRFGAPTGKENVPPGEKLIQTKPKDVPVPVVSKSIAPNRDLQRKNFLTQARLESLAKPMTQTDRSSLEICTMYEIGSRQQVIQQSKSKKAAWNAGPRPMSPREENSNKRHSMIRDIAPEVPKKEFGQVRVPTRLIQPLMDDVSAPPPRDLIFEHIETPEMYEDDWLGQQEVAITQLLNKLLNQSQASQREQFNADDLRASLLRRYNQPDTNLLYSRIQAATLYGSLSLSHEGMFQLQGLVSDMGRRKAFLKFWIDNYNNKLLQVALEVVTGRQISESAERQSGGSFAPSCYSRKCLAQHIESSILRHEDSGFKAAGTGIVSDLGNKTMLKSLMLIKALDLLKREPDALVHDCLFRPHAAFKTSMKAAQTLMHMLNTGVGDAIRTLRQLGYELTHEQKPLDEVNYRIDNLAVDIRDGVCLTRVVEVLLYRSASCDQDETLVANETTTICMPEGETVLVGHRTAHPLSQHLKMPCTSRAAKVWNVQIALAALHNVKNLSQLIAEISAEHIVDGYREKTIKLLWIVVARCGLPFFLDFGDIKQEIRRLVPEHQAEAVKTLDGEPYTPSNCEWLLKEWTRAVAASQGQLVRNFSTSFSDGKVFEAILDEYEPCLSKSTSTRRLPLHERLTRLGCNKQFSDIFSTRSGQVYILGKDFVLAALIFLCSRVVGPSKLCRNVVKIQRCWRKHWGQILRQRQSMKRELASACVASVLLKTKTRNGHTITCPDDLKSESPAKTEIESDIWLSL